MGISEKDVETAVGAGEGGELWRDVLAVAVLAAEHVSCDFEEDFVREREERHRGLWLTGEGGNDEILLPRSNRKCDPSHFHRALSPKSVFPHCKILSLVSRSVGVV